MRFETEVRDLMQEMVTITAREAALSFIQTPMIHRILDEGDDDDQEAIGEVLSPLYRRFPDLASGPTPSLKV